MSLIKIIITGGTFDKEYDELSGELYLKNTHLFEMLKQGRSRLNLEIKSLPLVDSLEMTDTYRDEILENCKNTISKKIVIIHGTDTLINTATFLAKENLDKTIVLTGAMIPYVFRNSDALFNFGSSLAFVQTLSKGVYISINGEYFDWNNVYKDKTVGEFKKIK